LCGLLLHDKPTLPRVKPDAVEARAYTFPLALCNLSRHFAGASFQVFLAVFCNVIIFLLILTLYLKVSHFRWTLRDYVRCIQMRSLQLDTIFLARYLLGQDLDHFLRPPLVISLLG
jgi:hypothetical protein